MDQDFMHVAVTMANATFTAFRIAAHVPQLIAVVRDPCGARAISVGSWLMFAIANLSNGVYAFVMASDWLMLAINLLSALSCVTIATVAWVKQRRWRGAPKAEERATVPLSSSVDSSGPAAVRRGAPRAAGRQATSRAMPNAAAAAAPPMASV